MIISIMQSAIFICMINYCLDNIKIRDNQKLTVFIILFSAIIIILPKMSQSILVSVFLTHICALILVYMFFKQNYKDAIIAYSLIYSISAIWIFVFGNLLYGIVEQFVPINHMKIITVILMYGSQVVLFLLCHMFRYKIKQIYKLLSHENIDSNYTIVISFLPDFLISLYFISYNIDSSIFKNIVIIALFAFLGFCILSVIIIRKKANYINTLNKTLTTKNNILKSIKLDYGIQISCLYELCDMEKYDDVASLLKNIINQNIKSIANENTKKYSLLSLATRHIKYDDVNIVIEDTADLKKTTMNELELYRIIVNIVNNAIKAMKNKGTIIAKSYEHSKDVVITIENNGEKIPKEIIGKIFSSGFTTKNNDDECHGYGLSIVKELIENHNGKIFVESNEDITKFTIALPIKEAV